MAWYLYDKKNIYFLVFASEKCNSGGDIDISLNIRNKRADRNIFELVSQVCIFFFTFYSVFQKSTFDCFIWNHQSHHFKHILIRQRRLTSSRFLKTQPNRKTTDFLKSFLIRCKCVIVSAKSWHYSWPWSETINTMPLFDGLVSGGEKTAIVIDLGAAYTKWVSAVSILFQHSHPISLMC